MRGTAAEPVSRAFRAPRFRFTITRMMGLTACVGVGLAAFRVHPSLGSFVTCVLLLAPIRTFEISDRCRAGGVPLSASRWAITLAGSLAVASVLLTLSAFFALSTYGVILPLVLPRMGSHWGFPGWSLGHVFAIFMTGFVGREAAVRLLPHLWPSPWADRQLSRDDDPPSGPSSPQDQLIGGQSGVENLAGGLGPGDGEPGGVDQP